MKLYFSFIVTTVALASIVSAAPQGKAFDHFLQIWFENQDYATINKIAGFTNLLNQGILLTNYNAITHPSQPNYIASAAGSNLGVVTDSNYNIPASVKTIYDLIENKGLTWKLYQENLPSPGFAGATAPGSYVRKHNPAISFDSIRLNADRAKNIVDEKEFSSDIASGSLPNYMFYTPNLKNDGHDTGAAYAGNFLSTFFNQTLNNPKLLETTVILITFDENANFLGRNKVWSLLLGAIPEKLKGTNDNTFYTHFSTLSTVEQNWDLGNLGQQDVNPKVSNVFDFSAKALGYTNVNVPTLSIPWNNLPIFGQMTGKGTD